MTLVVLGASMGRREYYLDEARKLSDAEIERRIGRRLCACVGRVHLDDPECRCRMEFAAAARVSRERKIAKKQEMS